MIDTDKYEGHQYERMQIDRWHLPDTPEEVMIANANLMNDAPLLLAEIKRLVRALRNADDVIEYALEMTSDDDATRVFEDYLEVIE